jgi:hypothetical protein
MCSLVAPMAELDLGAYGLAPSGDRDRDLPAPCRLGLLGLGEALDRQTAAAKDGADRRRGKDAVHFFGERPGCEPVDVEVDVLGIAHAVEEVAGLVQACLQDLEEGQVKQLDDLCVTELGHELTIQIIDVYVN